MYKQEAYVALEMTMRLTRMSTWHKGTTVGLLACAIPEPRSARIWTTVPRVATLETVRARSQVSRSGQEKGLKRSARRFRCCASLTDDLPLALIIGASVLYSAAPLLVPLEAPHKPKREEDIGLFGKGNVRYAAMGIISVIPIFDWLAWVFAWLDTSDQRYLVFAAIYAAPYIKTGFSLNPEDSWLPLLSVLVCIAHVQIDGLANSETPPEPLVKGLPRLKLPDVPPRIFSDWKEKVEAKLEELEVPLREAERKKEEEKALRQRLEEEEREAVRRREEEAKEEMRRWDEEFRKNNSKINEPPHEASSGTKENK